MRNQKKLIVLVAVLLALLVAMTGCAKKKSTVIATVGSGDQMREITLAQITNYYNNYLNYAAYYGQDVSTEDARNALLDNLLEDLIANEVKAYKARTTDGIALTEEEKKAVQTAAEQDYADFYQDFLDYAKQQGATDVTAQANKLLTDTLVQNGMTVKDVKNDFLKSQTDSKLIAKHQEKIMSAHELTAEELEQKFNEEVAAQTEAIATDGSSAYFMQQLYSDYGLGYQPYVIPENLFHVRHILVTDTEEKSGEELAKEIKEKIDAGEDFEELLKQYNTDSGEEAYPEGYVVGEGANFVEPFLNAALALEKEGDVSEPVKSDYGYHIIKRMSDVEPKTFGYDEVKESFDAMTNEAAQTDAYNKEVEAWIAEEGLVQRLIDNDAELMDEYRAIAK